MWPRWLFGGILNEKKPLYLYNTLTKKKGEFKLAPHAKTVRMYNCGPTVYDVQHVGNLSAFVFADIVRRILEYNDLTVKQVINITDVGHLSSDADEGEDKMSKGLRREGLELSLENMKALAERYTKIFLNDLRALNVDTERIAFPRASEHIPAQIAIAKTLEEKGYAYRTDDGIYFDTSRLRDYGALGGISREAAIPRIERSSKRHPNDFALWKFNPELGWDSPWGKGFPGWHLECSAMIGATLGKQIDIHTGGVEHIAIHHNNEIAQSEVATGKRPLSRFWLHRAHIGLEGEKIAKSVGNVVLLSEIVERGFHPLALRYLFLTAHYRTPANFTWDALHAAQTSWLKLRRFVESEKEEGSVSKEWQQKVHERFNDDLDTPGALATIWDMLKDRSVSKKDARATIIDADKVLGLDLAERDDKADVLSRKLFGTPVETSDLPERIRTLLDARESARKEKNWQHADTLRNDLEKMGYSIEDTSSGPRVFKKS